MKRYYLIEFYMSGMKYSQQRIYGTYDEAVDLACAISSGRNVSFHIKSTSGFVR